MTMPPSPGRRGLVFRAAVAALVALLHGGFYLLFALGQPTVAPARARSEAVRVEFIVRPAPPPVAAVAPAPAAEVRPAAPASRRRKAPVPAPVPVADAPDDVAQAPLDLEWRGGDAGAGEAGFPLGPPPVPAGDALAAREADRFRMRRQLSGKDVIEGTAKALGLWPEGYTTDPCPRIRANIRGLMTDGRAAGRRALEEELRRQRLACDD